MTRLIDADAIDKRYVPIAPIVDWGTVHYEWVAFIDDINELPTIDAEPVRHGKWIVTNEGVIKCSECKRKFILLKENYCPNCGCRMDKE